MDNLDRQNVVAGEQKSNRLHREKMDGDWGKFVTHRLNGMELSQE